MKSFESKDMKGLSDTDSLFKMYEGMGFLYASLKNIRNTETSYVENSKSLKHYVKDTLLPKCGDVKEKININDVQSQIETIDLKQTEEAVKSVLGLKAFDEMDLKTPTPSNAMFWAVFFVTQIFTVIVFFWTSQKDSNTYDN
ncbi:hypothetical protein EIN_516470 [Entamoeba invadens IP1]|uniref:Uncharacterized protein n=1 Tax=Entamoeba invadens IP1 TaxID=370355 RepID=L7FJZ2_ENTIV|nr:hypothetical protein EIN_516470 [Entamoeba invadens IP1]ELP85530.1 hypothetical protein EIN_516470 [Entamoeba invadens IP1]|eukprot:XP_004184876.1 hypothetical protein EIN_516470 [Entamoeba invadens IP1]